VPRLLKSQICRAISATGLDEWMGRVTGSLHRPWMVGYHAVVGDQAAMAGVMPGLAITAGTLEKHLDWIGQHFDFATLDRLASLEATGEPPPRPLAAVTFDDGYRGVFDHAWPILRRKGIPAAIFVVTDRIGSDAPLAHDQLYRYLRRQYSAVVAHRLTRAVLHSVPPAEVPELMDRLELPVRPGAPELPVTRPMLTELLAGGWIIGSHTRSHARLTSTAPENLGREIEGSRLALERGLGAPVRHFAYPDGAFDPAAVSAVVAGGFQFGYTTCAHRDPLRPELTLPRTMLWERSSTDSEDRFSPAILACQSSGLFERFSGCRADHVGRAIRA
jgi:peptidoglycan/xylan/chitin deacetylase (PgdA/CDA1 family)